MHPFGMEVYEKAIAYPDTVPVPPSRAGAEVMDWISAEQAETADVELPEGPDDFEISVQAWLRYVRAPFRPFVATWVAAIAKRKRVPLSGASLKKLRGMMRRDVDESAGMLWDATPGVIAAWAAWYPTWVEGLIRDRAALDPWFLLPAEQYHRKKQAQRTRDDTAKKQRQRDLKLGATLFAHVQENGGMVRWRPGLLAQTLSSQARGKRVDARKVAEMGAALVRVDAAKWKVTPKGRPWAMQLTVTGLNH